MGAAFAVAATAVEILGKEKEWLLRSEALDQTLDGLLLFVELSKVLEIGTGNFHSQITSIGLKDLLQQTHFGLCKF
jgi:hypothetical protein